MQGGPRICSEEARPVDGAVEDPGRGQASHPQRCEKRTLPPGARRVPRAPRRARPYRRRRLFVMPVSREKPGVSDPRSVAAACHTTRAAATSGRSCSEGRTVFFDGHVQSRHRAPDRRQTGSASFSSATDPVAPRSARPGCAGAAPTSGAARAAGARRDFARLPPTLLQQPHPRPAHAVLHRNVRGLHPGNHCRAGPVLRSIE